MTEIAMFQFERNDEQREVVLPYAKVQIRRWPRVRVRSVENPGMYAILALRFL